MIHLHQINKRFPDKVLFNDLDLVIKRGDRIGLVGPNGSGKTTLLRLIVGEENADSGTVQKERLLSIGYLPQEIRSTSKAAILNEVLAEHPEIEELERKIQSVSAQISEDPGNQTLLGNLGRLQDAFEHLDGWNVEARAKKVLGGLGFTPEMMETPLEKFSGGWRMRVALAKLLFRQPDILLLDEPTNHLDLASLIWLETFLNSWKGGLVLISHDRTFLDKTINQICEIHHRKVKVFAGNYTRYQQEKVLLRDQQEAAYKNQQKFIAETERFIERFRYKDSKASQVQSRVKMLDKLDRVEAPEGAHARIAVRIPDAGRAPRILAEFKRADKLYGELEVFRGLDLQIERGQKIGLVGPNGAGKSTLLKMLAGVEPLSGGDLVWGSQVKQGYFAQHQFEALPMDSDLFDLISAANPKLTMTEVRTFLGSFLFSGDTIEKQVKVLSGGEISRLALAKMLVDPAHLILLDEPTNHLDMNSRDVVQEAVSNFQGSMVCISHDRHFLNAVTNLIIEVDRKGVTTYPGNYDYYEWRKGEEAKNNVVDETTEKSSKPKTDPSASMDYQERKKLMNRLKKLPDLLTNLESSIAAQEEVISDPSNAAAYDKISAAMEQKERLELEYLELLEELETLQSQME